MLEAETEAGDYWRKCGEEALAHNVKGIVIMVCFMLWEVSVAASSRVHDQATAV